jgi:hypothetical protein
MYQSVFRFILCGTIAVSFLAFGQVAGDDRKPSDYGANRRLPTDLPPEIWAWGPGRTISDEYKKSLDAISEHSNFGLLSTAMRSPTLEVTLPETHDHLKRVVAHAHARGLRLALDLDVRLAQGTFLKRYPDDQQWMLRLRSFSLKNRAPLRAEVESVTLRDHMGTHQLLPGRFVRVFRVVGPRLDTPAALQEVTSGFKVLEPSQDRVAVDLPDAELSGSELIVAAGFQYRTPDVFSPAIIPFQREILEQYRDVPLNGVMKDEWGFPPVYTQGGREGDFWYSKPFDTAYAKAGGGDLVRDCILMTMGIGGAHQQRIAAVNRHMRLILNRNAEIERSFYDDVKKVFGPDAFVVVHATWGHMPIGDAFKNGYDWWWAKRDYGQTDEFWPLPVRTSLAKKMGGPVWYNQFYHRDVPPYRREIWRNASAGGRVNFLPYPKELWRDRPLMRAESRIRLLNYISRAPLDCPVAVMFGHAAALNWVGPHFGDLGVDFAEELWKLGTRADVIPSTEIESGAIKISEDGYVSYGAQKYRALVFLNPEYEPDATFEFLRRAARSRTYTFIRGESWWMFDGRPRTPGQTLVPGAMTDPTPPRLAQILYNWFSPREWPTDLAWLTDGTCILARGSQDPGGDPIDETFYCGRHRVTARATGVFGIKLGPNGELESLAGSEIRLVETPTWRLELADPTDLAIWRDQRGTLEGVVQVESALPDALLKLTNKWSRLLNAQPPH